MNLLDHHSAMAVRDGCQQPADDPVAAITQVHAEIDRRTREFAEQTGIACPDGCGRCCYSPEVETTIADILPLAAELVHRGEAQAVLERLDAQHGELRCVLYSAIDESRGRCTMYAWRPSICRLFGFAGRRDPDGHPQFSACRVHSETMPQTVAAAKQAVAEGCVSLPILSDLAAQVRAVAPSGSNRPLPINDALRQAIHTTALQAWFRSQQEGDNDHDGFTPTPRIPPLAA